MTKPAPFLFRISEDLRSRLKRAAAQENHTMKDELIIALEKHLKDLERK